MALATLSRNIQLSRPRWACGAFTCCNDSEQLHAIANSCVEYLAASMLLVQVGIYIYTYIQSGMGGGLAHGATYTKYLPSLEHQVHVVIMFDFDHAIPTKFVQKEPSQFSGWIA